MEKILSKMRIFVLNHCLNDAEVDARELQKILGT